MKFALLSAGCVVAQDIFLSNTTPSQADLVRARTLKQTGRLAGSSPQDISAKLNAHIQKAGGAKKYCQEHTLSELNAVTRQMLGRASDDLEAIYKSNGDARSKRYGTLAEYETSWDKEQDDEVVREAKCFEIGELWAHHLSEADKKDLISTVPALPVFEPEKTSNKFYEESTSCQQGHAMVSGGDGTSTHQWPDWPEELHYKAKGHGAYPFWWGGGSDSGTADLEVWWSEKQGAEKFYHSSCTGKSSGKGRSHLRAGKGRGSNATSTSNWLNGPCVHLMLAPKESSAKPQAYLYTADEKTCCISEPTGGSGQFGPSELLAPSQGTFWKTFDYIDERDFNGVHYQGKVKYYEYHISSRSAPITDFWYFTDLDGKPVQQGEGGTGPTDQGYPQARGHTVWHDYDPATLDTSGIDSSVFTIPSSCKTTSLSCAFP